MRHNKHIHVSQTFSEIQSMCYDSRYFIGKVYFISIVGFNNVLVTFCAQLFFVELYKNVVIF